MALGTGPDRLVDLLRSNWRPTRVGRRDIPDVVRDDSGTPTGDPTAGDGVLILRNREEVQVRHSRHDLIHCYHPSGSAPTFTDRGFDEQRVAETVQIDIEVADRTDQSTTPPERLLARDRMIGERDSVVSLSEPPYGGIAGEVRYLLETVRRGIDEWDRVETTPVGMTLENSNATVRYQVTLTELASNTV